MHNDGRDDGDTTPSSSVRIPSEMRSATTEGEETEREKRKTGTTIGEESLKRRRERREIEIA